MTLISKKNRGNRLLSGFGTDNYLEDFFTDRAFDPSPAMNVSENDERYKIEIGIPGFKREELTLNLQDSHLFISGKHKDSHSEDNEEYRTRQFDYSDFSQSFQLPRHAEVENIEAKYNDGILKILVPKKAGHQHSSASIQIK